MTGSSSNSKLPSSKSWSYFAWSKMVVATGVEVRRGI